MSKSWKRAQRDALGRGVTTTEREFDLMVVLADIIEATPQGQRTASMTTLLDEVRTVQSAHPQPGGGA